MPSFRCSRSHCFAVGHNSYKTLFLLDSLNTTFVSAPFSFALFAASHNSYNHILLTRLTRFSYRHLRFDALLARIALQRVTIRTNTPCSHILLDSLTTTFVSISFSLALFAAWSYIVFLLEQLLVIGHRAKPYLLEYSLFCNRLDFEQV